MMRNNRFKSSVKELNSGIDKAQSNIAKLQKMDGHLRKKVYQNENTKVEVLVKTKRPQSSKENDWSSILSDSNASEHKIVKKPALSKKRFVQSTTASKAKARPGKDTVDQASKLKASKIQPLASDPDVAGRFSNRTLQTFLKEMRLAIKHKENREQISEILDDLEHVATNLNLEEPSPASVAHFHGNNVKDLSKDQLLDLSMYKTESKKLKSDIEVLRRNVEKKEKKIQEMDNILKAKDAEMYQMKHAVDKLAENGDQMFKQNASLEEQIKLLQNDNLSLKRELYQERLKNSKFEMNFKAMEAERSRLQKDIGKSKTNPQQDAKFEENVNRMLAKNPLELETGPNDDTTIELNISTDRSVTDSALGDGISDSQPISGSISMPIVENVIPQVAPIPRSTQTLNPETSFQPVEMNLSETKSSSVLSQDIAEESSTTNDSQNFRELIDDKLRQGNVQAATGNVDAKLAEFLHKVKNDDRFQISLSSQNVPSRNFPNEDTKLTFGTDIDSSTLNESKFRRGLQDQSEESDQN